MLPQPIGVLTHMYKKTHANIWVNRSNNHSPWTMLKSTLNKKFSNYGSYQPFLTRKTFLESTCQALTLRWNMTSWTLWLWHQLTMSYLRLAFWLIHTVNASSSDSLYKRVSVLQEMLHIFLKETGTFSS